MMVLLMMIMIWLFIWLLLYSSYIVLIHVATCSTRFTVCRFALVLADTIYNSFSCICNLAAFIWCAFTWPCSHDRSLRPGLLPSLFDRSLGFFTLSMTIDSLIQHLPFDKAFRIYCSKSPGITLFLSTLGTHWDWTHDLCHGKPEP